MIIKKQLCYRVVVYLLIALQNFTYCSENINLVAQDHRDHPTYAQVSIMIGCLVEETRRGKYNDEQLRELLEDVKKSNNELFGTFGFFLEDDFVDCQQDHLAFYDEWEYEFISDDDFKQDRDYDCYANITDFIEIHLEKWKRIRRNDRNVHYPIVDCSAKLCACKDIKTYEKLVKVLSEGNTRAILDEDTKQKIIHAFILYVEKLQEHISRHDFFDKFFEEQLSKKEELSDSECYDEQELLYNKHYEQIMSNKFLDIAIK